MNVKRLAIGTLVGLVVLYALGWLFWEGLFVDYFAAHSGSAIDVDREALVYWAVIFGTALYALLLALALEARKTATIVNGTIVGAVVGVLVWGTSDFTLYGFTNMSDLAGTIADTVLEGIRGGVAGAILAAVLARVGG